MSEEKRRWQFSIRDVLLVMFIVGLAVGWFVDHYRLTDELERQRSLANTIYFTQPLTTNTWGALQDVTGAISLNTPTTSSPPQPDPSITDPPGEIETH